MRILQVNKFFWQSAGPERYMLELADLLGERGHDVDFFAMQHERNLPSACGEYFVSEIRYRGTSLGYKLKTAPKAVGKNVYSLESRRKMHALLGARRPDVAHLHVISRQISPSILHALRDRGVPVVQTVHNAELVCPAAHLYIEHRGEICRRCVGGRYFHAALHRCVRRSWTASALSCVAQYFHRGARLFEKHVDLFLCPSRFLAGNLIAGGIPREKIRHLPNFVHLDRYVPDDEVGRYGVFVGRLSPEKGLKTLLAAAAVARQVPLVIVGEGGQRPELERWAAQRGLDNVTFAGYRQGDALQEAIRRSAFVVLPSECYENSPMAIFEGGALAKAVVASDIGGVPELVRDGDNGLLFEPGNAGQLAEKMLLLHHNHALCREMGRRARAGIEAVCRTHYDRLMEFYEEVSSPGVGP